MGITLVMTAYLGAETLWNLVEGWLQMVRECRAAKTFAELWAAGDRYGKKIGEEAARVLVMLAAAALSEVGFAERLVTLPAFARAATLFASESGGVGLTVAVGQAESVVVSASGVSVCLPVGAVAMAAGPKSGTQSGPLDDVESGEPPRKIYDRLKDAPEYPSNFEGIQNGTKYYELDNKRLLEQLRRIEPGRWYKVFKDGWVGNQKVSVHYFESKSGKVFNVKVYLEWSRKPEP